MQHGNKKFFKAVALCTSMYKLHKNNIAPKNRKSMLY